MQREERDLSAKEQETPKRRETLRERLCRVLDLPPDGLSSETLIEIRGRASMTVSGASEILTYTATLIRLGGRHTVLRIEGRELFCASFSSESVRIDGRIESLRFEEV